MIGCGSCKVPCDALKVCADRVESAVRELDPTARVGSLSSSVEPGARQVLAEFPFAPLVVGGCVLGESFRIFVVDR